MGSSFPSSARLSCRSLERTCSALSIGSNGNRGFYRKMEGEKTLFQRSLWNAFIAVRP